MRWIMRFLAVAALLLAVVGVVLASNATLPFKPSASSAQVTTCKLQIRPAVVIEVSSSRWPHVADHDHDVISHYRRILHLDRDGADENRDESLSGYPTRTGYDRDEYPPAVSAEGGEGANVRYVPSSENRSQGSVMGHELNDSGDGRPYCNGTHFRLVVTP